MSKSLGEIKQALSNHFGIVVSVEKLQKPRGNETVAEAKSVDVCMALYK